MSDVICNENWRHMATENRAVELELDKIPYEGYGAKLKAHEIRKLADVLHHGICAMRSLLLIV